VNARGPFDLTALHMLCAADGYEELISRLIQEGAAVNAQDVMGRTPLHEAVRCRSPEDIRSLETVAILLDSGADPHLGDRWNETSLHAAETSLARHSWWSGVASEEARRARAIVALLGGNVEHGVEQVC
jgi:ankyrin repeat protein